MLGPEKILTEDLKLPVSEMGREGIHFLCIS